VYLSYPFCAQKCTYCNFASGVFPREREQAYLAALDREIRAHRWEWRPETVYLGGGTPSNLAPEALRTVLDAIPGRPWLEATMEAAPGSITAEKAGAWASLGIGRVSLGVQSFVEAEIRRTGRKHTAETVVREMQILRQQGIVNCNLDLIAGLPGQTAYTWRESLDWIERLEPAHVSIYMLEVDEDSRLGKEILRGGSRYGAAEIPADDGIADFYEEAVERLAGMGIRRYEISNFARPGFESRHNLKYWKLEPYVGFGADAHSFDGLMRRQNRETVEDYLGGDGSSEDPFGGVGRAPRSAAGPLAGLRPEADEGVGRGPGGPPHRSGPQAQEHSPEDAPSAANSTPPNTGDWRGFGGPQAARLSPEGTFRTIDPATGTDGVFIAFRGPRAPEYSPEDAPYAATFTPPAARAFAHSEDAFTAAGLSAADALVGLRPKAGQGPSRGPGGPPHPLTTEPADPGERFYVGLRLMEGIRPTAEDWARFDLPIHRFVEAGLLEIAAGRLRLTGRGVLLSNEVFQEFLTV
jgi:oxygen-independent coproporphyrinogen III oxidase